MEVNMEISLKAYELETRQCHVMRYPKFDANLNNWSIKPVRNVNELSKNISYELTYKVNNEDMCKHITYKCELPSPFLSSICFIIGEIDICLKNEDGIFQVHHVIKNYHGTMYVADVISSYFNNIAYMITSVKNNDIDSYNKSKELVRFSMCLNDIVMIKRNTKELNYIDEREECCVCYKETCRKTTKCNHALCTNCFSQLKKMNTNKKINCPYCRSILC